MHEKGYDVDYRLISNRADNNIEVQPKLNSLINDFEILFTTHPQHFTLRLAMAQLYRQNGQLQEATNASSACH